MTYSALKEQYNRLWSEAIKKIESGQIHPDYRIDDSEDNRYGLTLIMLPSPEIRNVIAETFQLVRKTVPEQYFYPISDIHLTLLSIISCQPGFDPEQIKINEYVSLLKPILENTEPFRIEFKGITASPEAVMVCGYPEEDSLNSLRNKIRTAFKDNSLYHTIDKRYTIQTAHVTIMRFRKKVDHLTEFVEQLNSIKQKSFGADLIRECHLVGNDWYQRENSRRTIESFKF